MTKYQAFRASVRACLNDANILKNRAVISYTEKKKNGFVTSLYLCDILVTIYRLQYFCDVAQMLLPHTGHDAHIKACKTLATKRTKKETQTCWFQKAKLCSTTD